MMAEQAREKTYLGEQHEWNGQHGLDEEEEHDKKNE